MSLTMLETSTTIEKSLTWIRHLAETMAPMPGSMTGVEGNTTDASSSSGTSAPTDGMSTGGGLVFDKGPGTGDFEFAAFVLWYLFLVVCCVLPTCCAFRRRRMLESRLADQHAAFERSLRQQNIIIWNNMQAQPELESEAAMEERSKRITEALQPTTFIVKAQDISELPTTKEPSPEDPESVDENNDASVGVDEELGGSSSTLDQDLMDSKLLTLPSGNSGTDPEKPRTVPGGCAICLCAYEEGDSVTWSACQEACPHAFHTECVIPWLAKNRDPKCPCCRQHFCFIEPIAQPPPHLTLLTTFALVPTAVATPVRNLPFFVRGPLRLPIATPEFNVAPQTVPATTPNGHVIGHPPTLNLSQPYRGPTVVRSASTTSSASSNRRQQTRQGHTPSWMTRLADIREPPQPSTTTSTEESERSPSS